MPSLHKLLTEIEFYKLGEPLTQFPDQNAIDRAPLQGQLENFIVDIEVAENIRPGKLFGGVEGVRGAAALEADRVRRGFYIGQ